MVDGDQRVDAGIARRLQLLELQLFLVLRQGPQRIMVPADRPLTALTILFPRPRGDGPATFTPTSIIFRVSPPARGWSRQEHHVTAVSENLKHVEQAHREFDKSGGTD